MPPFGQARRADSSPRAGLMSTFALGHKQIRRSGYGAMQLAGPFAFGTPPDRASAIGVLRAAVAAGVDHIDTAQYYGPGVVNDLIREALYPYAEGLGFAAVTLWSAMPCPACCAARGAGARRKVRGGRCRSASGPMWSLPRSAGR
jgi:hypothetical protein